MWRKLAVILVMLMLMVAAVNPAFADEEKDNGNDKDKDKEKKKSKDLPEVPIVLIYPAAGVLTYLGYRMVAARRERDGVAA